MTTFRLTLIEGKVSDNKLKAWYKCECGSVVERYKGNVNSGKTRSCGCLRREVTSECSTKHGLSNSPEYGVWSAIKDRCYNPNVKSYKDYGSRGIQMCDRWKDSFEAFYQDMGTRPSAQHTIERKDNDGLYEPSNCVWLPKAEQPRNRRNSVYLTASDGRTYHRLEWEQLTGIPWSATRKRIKDGWSVDDALFTPVRLRG